MKRIVNITATPTVSTSPAYTAGDAIGGLIKLESIHLTGASRATIKSIRVVDLAKQDSNLDIIFYISKPATSGTDNTALDLADADLSLILHVENITAYDDFADNSVAGVSTIDVTFAPTDAIYAQMIARGTPTYVATTDVKLMVTVEIE